MKVIPHSRPWINQGDRDAVADVLLSGMIAQGEKVRAFEDAVSGCVGCSGSVALSSGTAALMLAMKALRVPSASEVILPTYTCPSVMDAVQAVGAVPVLCDVGPDWNMTVQTAGRRVTPRTSAIIVVSTFGIANPAEPFRDFGLPVIEDCCQRFAPNSGRGAADVRVFSFHATKCLTTGEGGTALSGDPDLVQSMRRLRDGHALAEGVGTRVAAPMTDLQAALGLSQLARYDQFLDRRQRIAGDYFRMPEDGCFGLPHAIQAKSIFFRFPLRWAGDFGTIRRRFADRGVQVRKGIDTLLHRTMGLDRGLFPTAEKLYAETVSIPIYPALSDDERDRVVAACLEIACSP